MRVEDFALTGAQILMRKVDLYENKLLICEVVSMGPLAFRNRETLVPWPEGRWCDVGDRVMVSDPGSKNTITLDDNGIKKQMVIASDFEVIGTLKV